MRSCRCRHARARVDGAADAGVNADVDVAVRVRAEEAWTQTQASRASSLLRSGPRMPPRSCRIPPSPRPSPSLCLLRWALPFYAVVKHTKVLPDRRPLTRGPLWFLPEWHPSPSHLPQVPSYQLRLAVRLHLLCIAGPMGPSAAHLVSPRPVSYGGRDSLSRRAEASSNKTGVLS